MQDRRRLIELIQELSRQEGARQPSADAWLRAQDEKARDSAQRAPDNAAGADDDAHDHLDNEANDDAQDAPPNASGGPTA
uniref:hypothetical protein n=1 Tax=unclassified Variovorax TaxID=663243 RepID=UPI000D3436D8